MLRAQRRRSKSQFPPLNVLIIIILYIQNYRNNIFIIYSIYNIEGITPTIILV